MDIDYILITLDGEEPIELECEEDGKFLLASLEAVLACEVTSLRYRNEATGNFRFVRIANGELLPPKDGWGLRLYYVSRKGDPCVGADSSAVKLNTEGVKEELETSIKCEDATVKQEVKSFGLSELTKKQLQSKAEKSLVARRALSQWNRMNTTVRGIVNNTQFHGSGGLSKCEGTTQEEATKNQMIRRMISEREEVKAYYEVFVVEDKTGKITLDHLKAADHVRVVLNNRKRGSVQPVKDKDKEPQDLEHGTTGKDDDRTVEHSPVHVQPLHESSPRNPVAPLKRKKRTRSEDKENQSNNNDGADERSTYELERAKRVRENREFMFGCGLTSQILEEADATIVARKWLDNVLERGVRPKVEHVSNEVEDLGLPPVKNGANFRGALIHLGNELVKNELVSLSKKAGLSKQDVNIL